MLGQLEQLHGRGVPDSKSVERADRLVLLGRGTLTEDDSEGSNGP